MATLERREATSAFIEEFALSLTAAGMQRMAARVFAALLSADDGALTARQLADVLRVSPAAVSGAMRYLEQARMARRIRRPGERVDHYTLAGEGVAWYESTASRSGLLDRMAQSLATAVDAIGEDTPAGARLAETREFFEYLTGEMRAVIDRWHERRQLSNR
jgi:DNA-binding transcriptional regulator GbsR (MarR family)